MYMSWCQVSGYDPFPILEEKTWNYCSFLKESCAPATRADSFIKAAPVTIQLLSMKASSWDTGSDRISGSILQSLDTKRELVQASPMSVKAVETLEDLIFDTSVPMGKQIIAGFVRFCVGARLRHSDAIRITTEPKMDESRPASSDPGSEEDEHDNKMLGFIETHGTITKTNQAKHKRRRPIPMVAHSWGLKRKIGHELG